MKEAQMSASEFLGPIAVTTVFLLFAVPLGDVKRINVELSSKQPFEKWYTQTSSLIRNITRPLQLFEAVVALAAAPATRTKIYI